MEDPGAQIHSLCYLDRYDYWYLCYQKTRHICASLLLLQGSLLVWTQLQLEREPEYWAPVCYCRSFPFLGSRSEGWVCGPCLLCCLHVWWGCGLSQSSQGIGVADIIHVFPPVLTPLCTSIHTPSDALIY